MNFINSWKIDIERHSQRYLWGSIALFILFFSFLVLKKYYYFGYNISDLAIFNQTLYNTLRGQWFDNTVGLNNYFSDHFSPILLLFLPFYAIKQSAETLLIIQVIITALCAWPIFVIAKKYSGINLFAYGVSLLWLINPFVHRQVMYEFHIFHVMAFFFFWAFYFYQQKRVSWFIFFSILTLLAREDAAFLFLGLALLSLVEKRSKKWALNIFFWALIYFIIAIVSVRFFSPTASYKYLLYYSWLGGNNFQEIIVNWFGHPLAVLGHILTIQNLFLTLAFFLPFLFAPFFSKKYLLISFFPYLQLLMTSGGFNGVHFYSHYTMLLLPGVYLAYIFGLWHLIENKKKDKKVLFIHKNKPFFIVVFIFSCLYFLFFMSPMMSVMTKKFLPNYHQDRQKIIESISAEASVCADPSLLSSLSSRSLLYNIDYVYYGKSQFAERDFELPSVDYIFLDMNQFIATINGRNSWELKKHGDPLSTPDKWAKTLSSYNLVEAKDAVFLWKNKNITTEKTLLLYEFTTLDDTSDTLVKNWSLAQGKDGQILKVSYNNLKSNNYLIRFYQAGQYWDLPFDYGLYSLAQKEAGQTMTVYYYINDQVDSFEIYHYQGRNILGDWGNLDLFFKKEKVFGKVEFSQ